MLDLVVDISNWQGPLTADLVRCWRDQGVSRVIVQAVAPPAPYPPGVTRQQIETCRQVGMPVDAYIWLWLLGSWANFRWRLALLDGLDVDRVWLDVEDVSPDGLAATTVPQRIAQVHMALAEIRAAGHTAAGVYTGAWYWRGYMGNTSEFVGEPLWAALYGPRPQTWDDFATVLDGRWPHALGDPARPDGIDVPDFGGWTHATMVQYTSQGEICRGGLDLNVAVPEADMDQIEDLKRQLADAGLALALTRAVAAVAAGTPTPAQVEAVRRLVCP